MRRSGVGPAALVGLIILLILLAALALSAGAVRISPLQAAAILLDELGLNTSVAVTDSQRSVMTVIRLPRVVMGGLLGAGLALAGAVIQALFRNPLADPGLIGISSGAAVMTALMLVLGAAGLLIPLGAMLGAGLTIALMYRLSTVNGRTSVATMLLIGIAVNALAAALLGVVVASANDDALRNIEFWSFGSLARANWAHVHTVALFLLPVLPLLVWLVRPLNIVLLGESDAAHLGVDVRRLRWVVVLTCALLIGPGVAFAGSVGFVGLVVPVILRRIVGADHRVLIPAAALLGAALLIGADLFARTAVTTEIPLGMVTALVGAPFFMALLLQDREGLP
ncbi:MAG: iron ABC transporter permease [Anaerolineae bacterium]